MIGLQKKESRGLILRIFEEESGAGFEVALKRRTEGTRPPLEAMHPAADEGKFARP